MDRFSASTGVEAKLFFISSPDHLHIWLVKRVGKAGEDIRKFFSIFLSFSDDKKRNMEQGEKVKYSKVPGLRLLLLHSNTLR